MNIWIEKSIELANAPGYLDNLHSVYPAKYENWRPISNKLKIQIEKSFDSPDNKSLLENLLKLPKFPIDDPYVSLLRKNIKFLQFNPSTVDILANRIRKLGFPTVRIAIEQPKSISRIMGKLFKEWLMNIGYKMVSEEDIKNITDIAVLKGSDHKLRKFAHDNLKCELEKGIDFVIKVKKKFIIGEAKFLTDIGGSQNANFDSAMKFLKNKSGKALRIAVLDGVVWFKSNNKMHKTIKNIEEIALSALLLKDFIKTL
jgi:hypothetical protein